MPFVPIPSATKVTVSGTLFGQLVQNVWYVQQGGPPTPAQLNAVAGIFQVNYANIIAPLSNQLTVSEFTARWLGDIAGPETTLISSPAQAGTAISPSSAGNVALCVSLRTALAGRRFRGRKFFSGIPEGATAENAIDSTLAAFIVSAIDDMMSDLNANTTPLAIVSYAGLTVVPVVAPLVTDLFVDSQRRRLTKRGR
jgi:hypothetical protein